MPPKKNNTDNQNTTSDSVVMTAAPTLAEFNPRDPQTLLATAKQLAQFVTDNHLASNIQGRSYVQAEGWQFLFAVAGLDVICAKPTRLDRASEVCYEAEARLFDQAGHEVGYGYAICSDAERTKKGWAEYAIASMAQTRAIGKAGRNRFAFVMKAAGFEPTPAEEMSEVGTSASVVAETPKKPVAEASAPVSAPLEAYTTSGPSNDEVRQQLAATRSTLDLKDLWNKLTASQQAELKEEFTAARARITAAVQQAAATVVREAPAAMKIAGDSTGLVDEFVDQPVFGPGPAVDYATTEQRQTITSLLNHPLITRKEKTALLLKINQLDRERARQAIIKLRTAIADREGVDPRDGVRASITAFVLRGGRKLTAQQAEGLNSLAADPAATLDFLVDALELAQNALVDDETYGTDAELEEVENAIAA